MSFQIAILRWLKRWVPDPPAPKATGTLGPIYLYFDEAGDLNFKGFGTRHFLCGVLATRDPWSIDEAIYSARKRVYHGRLVKESFHAAEELQAVRNVVFEAIQNTGGFEYFVSVVEKKNVPSSYHDQARFYTFIADFTLRNALQHFPTADPIYLVTDRLPLKNKQDAIVKGFKNCLAELAEDGNRRYALSHDSLAGHPCLQVADYMNWAVYRKWESEDRRSYDIVSNFIKRELSFDCSLLV